MAAFDPYHKWFGIPPAEQPVNHYRLLGVTLFESDPDVIDAATDQRVAYLRQCATGQHIAESQKLLNEVAAARLCLINVEKRREYDDRLRRSLAQTWSATNPAAPSSTPHQMPWESQADDIVEEGGVPDFNATPPRTQSSVQRLRAWLNVTPQRIAAVVLSLSVVGIGITFTTGRWNHTEEANEARQVSSPDDPPVVAPAKMPRTNTNSPVGSINKGPTSSDSPPVSKAAISVSPQVYAYSEPYNEKQTLDVYASSAGKSRPIVFWIHGGGWQRGDKNEVEQKPLAFQEKGFVFVSTNYRLLPNVTVKQIAGDVAKALRWTHDHAAEFGGNSKSIFVMGHSAGAQTAALICTDDSYLKAEGLSLSLIKGCVPVDGDTFDVPMQIAAVEQHVAEVYMRKFGVIAQQKALSPVTHVAPGKNIPPFLILHVADHPETKPQAQRLATVLQTAGISAKAYAAKDKTHFTITTELGVPGDRPTVELFDFLNRAVRVTAPAPKRDFQN